MLLAQELIQKKRAGLPLAGDEIASLVTGMVNGSVSDAQLAAFCMATCFQGMSANESSALTLAMRDSGTVLAWGEMDLPGPVMDKHSTGGVGDLVSLVLAPMVVACGGVVPMITGRGLGHTGGTQDKLESIPGYCSTPDLARFKRVVRECGMAIIGQTVDLAPADRRLYAIRDVTGTVDCLPLITASILSKKFAAGLQMLVMDIKCGNGAQTPELAQAQALAHSIIATANAAGMACSALITDMNQPLAPSVGNAIEMREALRYLRSDNCPARLHQTVLALGSEMLLLGGLADDERDAQVRLLQALRSGRAAEVFARSCTALGGPSDLLDKFDRYLPQAPLQLPLYAPVPEGQTAWLRQIDTRAVGMAVLTLGAGRGGPGQQADLGVGLTQLAELGQEVDAHTPLAIIHARDEASLLIARTRLLAAFDIGRQVADHPQQVYQTLRGKRQDSELGEDGDQPTKENACPLPT
ncbi:thymidine phosphorylase [Undibacterium sp. TS12]|uniref:thymidine phosphorylase n=1 Tax=Undibacterium sp. TS12 TaxID=2908202 RepID=UPI001F4CD970|nr:thymidine phosphorylase [Undibacterium sp. TS12]MCH8617998.1 thymidine phosphorylase [Undibacterium sp. TS12]